MNKLYNRVKVITPTAGTGTVTLSTAVAGFLTFAQGGALTGDVVTYLLEEGTNFEVGQGTYTLSGLTLTRDIVYRSTGVANIDKITLVGAATVAIVAAAEDFYLDLEIGTPSIVRSIQEIVSQLGLSIEAISDDFEAAVVEAADSGVQVRVGPGTFNRTTQLTISGPLTKPFKLTLDPNTIITLDAALQGGVLYISDAGDQIIEIEGGVFDASAQAGPTGSNSWGLIMLQNVGGGYIEDVTFLAAPDYRTVRSDSGIFVTGQDLKIQRCYFRGFSDSGVYVSGNASETGTNGIVTAFSSFYGNGVDIIYKRQGVNCIHTGNIHDSSLFGIATGVAEVTLLPGKRLIVTNNDLRNMGTPARLERADGTTFSNNRMRGWGKDLDGVVQTSTGAIVLLGTNGAIVSDNLATQSDAEATLYGIILGTSTLPSVGTRHSEFNLVDNNILDGGTAPGCFRAIYETVGSDFNCINNNRALGTWVAEVVALGANTTVDHEDATMRRSWRVGNIERFAVGADSIDISPSSSGSARIFRPSVATQYFSVLGDGAGNLIKSMSGAAAGKIFLLDSSADGTLSGGLLGHARLIQGGKVSSIETASTAAAARHYDLVSTIPEYADDAAAAAGGLIVGNRYRTGSVLKIRVA